MQEKGSDIVSSASATVRETQVETKMALNARQLALLALAMFGAMMVLTLPVAQL